MKLYNLGRLARLFPTLTEAAALEQAVELRKTLHSLDENEANSDRRYRKVPVRLLQKGVYYASGVGFASGPCSTSHVQPDPSDAWCQRLDLEREMQNLPARQRKILILRSVEGLTLEETAGEVGLSVSRVQQLEKAAKRVLAAALAVEV